MATVDVDSATSEATPTSVVARGDLALRSPSGIGARPKRGLGDLVATTEDEAADDSGDKYFSVLSRAVAVSMGFNSTLLLLLLLRGISCWSRSCIIGSNSRA